MSLLPAQGGWYRAIQRSELTRVRATLAGAHSARGHLVQCPDIRDHSASLLVEAGHSLHWEMAWALSAEQAEVRLEEGAGGNPLPNSPNVPVFSLISSLHI